MIKKIALIAALFPFIIDAQVTTATSNSKNVNLDQIVSITATQAGYKTIQDMLNIQVSSGRISGGFVTDAGGGKINVSAAEVVFKTTESRIGKTGFARIDSVSNLTLTDNASNYVYAFYNNGNPVVFVSTDPTAIFGSTTVLLGNVYREGNTLHIVDFTNYGYPSSYSRMVLKEVEKATASGAGFAEHISGTMLGSSGRNLLFGPGVFYAGFDRFTNVPFNSANIADSFANYYRNGLGGWNKQTGQYLINNTQWDDGSGTLQTLTNNRYAAHFIYLSYDANEVSTVFSQGDYIQLADAINATLPTQATLPPFLRDFSAPIGKVIIQKNAATMTTYTYLSQEISGFSQTVAHNDLSGLQGGNLAQYYHLTQSEYTGTGSGVFVRDSLPTIKKLMVGTATQGNHRLALGGTDTTTGINIVRTDINLDRATLAKSTDTASINLRFTQTGKPSFSLITNNGQRLFTVDTTGATFQNSTAVIPALSFLASGTTITKMAGGSITYDFGSIPNGVDSSFTFTVDAVTAGMPVFLGFSTAPEGNGAIWNAYCTTNTLVTVRVQNRTGAALDPASRTYKVMVFNF